MGEDGFGEEWEIVDLRFSDDAVEIWWVEGFSGSTSIA